MNRRCRRNFRRAVGNFNQSRAPGKCKLFLCNSRVPSILLNLPRWTVPSPTRKGFTPIRSYKYHKRSKCTIARNSTVSIVRAIEFYRGTWISLVENLGQHLGLRNPHERNPRERITVNQLANCCPLLESIVSNRCSAFVVFAGVCFSEQGSSAINRNGYDTRFLGTTRRFPRARPPRCRRSGSIERRQFIGFPRIASSLIVTRENWAIQLLRESWPKVHFVDRLRATVFCCSTWIQLIVESSPWASGISLRRLIGNTFCNCSNLMF